MAEKLQSKVKLRSGEVITIDHVKPSKPAPKTTKPKEPETGNPADETQTTNPNDKPKETK